MSTLHISHIQKHISSLYKDKIDISDLNQTDKELDIKMLTRALSAYSIQILCNATPDQIAPYIVDGSDDNGIDCFYYDSTEKVMYISQAKWIKDGVGEPDLGDVKKFTDGIRDLVNQKYERFNSKLNKYTALIGQILSDPVTKYKSILVYTGNQDLATHASRTIKDLLDEINDAGELLEFIQENQSFLHRSLANFTMRSPIDIDIGLKYWGKVELPHKSFYGQLNASSIAEWWNRNATNLFDKNLRGVLGDTDVNAEVRSTLIDEPEKFWYFNNGITILAKKITKTMVGGGDNDFGTFHCEDISIVNGAQTVSTIGRFAGSDIEKVGKASVHCRVIQITPENALLGDQITKTNNRQNRIENRDFVSLDPEQLRIKTELAIEGISYIIQRNERIVKNDSVFDLIDSTTALSCIANDPTLFVQLKREISKLWGDISKAPYKKLFNPKVSSLYILRAMIIQRIIDTTISEIVASKEINSSKQAFLVHGNRMIASKIFTDLPVSEFSKPDFDFDQLIKCDYKSKIMNITDRIILEINKSYPNAVIPTLFKNLSKCTDIYQKI